MVILTSHPSNSFFFLFAHNKYSSRMGVKLQNIIVRKHISYQDFVGKIIAIDAPNIIMGLFNFVRKNSDASDTSLILDRTQRPISHLYGLLYRVNFYYSKGIFPIFCFDGKVSELKRIISKEGQI